MAPVHAASSLSAYSNPQPFEQIIKIHLYLICLLELIEFLRLVNVSGCTLPPNGDPAAGAMGAPLGFYASMGTKPIMGHGTGCPQHPQLLLGMGAGMNGRQHPPSSVKDAQWHTDVAPKPASLHWAYIKRYPNPFGFLWQVPVVP